MWRMKRFGDYEVKEKIKGRKRGDRKQEKARNWRKRR